MQLKQTFWYKLFLCIITCSPLSLHSYDNAHFYRATRFFSEPRFEKPWLASVDLDFSGGHTSTALNARGKKVNVLDIYGTHNMHQIGVNVPRKNSDDTLDRIITNLAQVPASNNFGVLSYKGQFSILELNTSYTQNFNHGFFMQALMPVRALRIDRIHVTDLTPETGTYNRSTPEWTLFLGSFDALLSRYSLTHKPTINFFVGDTSLLVGWTKNYQDTVVLDYIDFTAKAGVLCPTGKAKNEREIFSLPTGYNKHWGIPLSADLACGIYEWLSAGAHLDVLPFFKRTYNTRLKTAYGQSGMIKLANACATVKRGTQYVAGIYIKADHIANRLSFTTGYSYARKGADDAMPLNPTLFNPAIVNSDEMLAGWSMHTLNLILEYDFSKEHHVCGPRLNIFANVPLGGKRIFKTAMNGISCGLEIALAL